MIDNVTLNDYRRVCSFCTIYIVLLIIGISRSFLFLCNISVKLFQCNILI